MVPTVFTEVVRIVGWYILLKTWHYNELPHFIGVVSVPLDGHGAAVVDLD